jgi:DNA-binding XRE family transcriptional regulator
VTDHERLKNRVQSLRQQRMLTKTELAKKAGLSTLTLDRIEAGMPCRIDTKRKLLLALGLTVADRDQVFGPEEDSRDDSQDRTSSGVAVGPHQRAGE